MSTPEKNRKAARKELDRLLDASDNGEIILHWALSDKYSLDNRSFEADPRPWETDPSMWPEHVRRLFGDTGQQPD